MGEAFLWGAVAGSSLVLGGLIALRLPISRRLLGLIMAFGAGVLISAVAFELVHEAFETSAKDGGVAFGLLAGGLHHGGKLAGLFTTVGFALAFAISALQWPNEWSRMSADGEFGRFQSSPSEQW